MTDTVRTQSDLLTNLFQDGQASGAITAQDMRDLIVSVTPSYGGLYFSTPSATSISVAGTFVKAAGTTTLTFSSSDVDDASSADNRLRYTGTPGRIFHVTAHVSISPAAGTSQDIGVILYKYDDSAASGATIAASEARTTMASTDVEEITTVALVELDTNDYVEVHITNNTNTNNLTVDHGSVTMKGFLK